MKKLFKYWKLLIALILVGMSLHVYNTKYKVEEAAYQTQSKQMQQTIDALSQRIRTNKEYADIQDELEEASAELDASRLSLYQHFPVELREEDQIMYVLYLETIFGTEINFAFSQAQSLSEYSLRDGANMMGLLLQVNYETTYQGFQDMISYLSSDDRLVSVYDATISYDAQKDIAAGTLNLILYMLDSDKLEYTAPDIAIPQVGKDNLFE